MCILSGEGASVPSVIDEGPSVIGDVNFPETFPVRNLPETFQSGKFPKWKVSGNFPEILKQLDQ